MAKKKVLLMSASIGTGHTQAARAIEEYMRMISDDWDVEHIDFLSNDFLSIDNIVKETYIKILDVFPILYDLMYYSSQGYKKGLAVKMLIAWGLKRRMLRVLEEKKPDVIIFTHPFPAGAAALLKRQHRLHIPIIGVITDFAVHQLWVYPQIDAYFVAASPLKKLLAAQGIDEKKIIVSGIPVRKAFSQVAWQWDESHERNKNVLIMGGGLGMGSIRQSLVRLDRLDAIDSFTVVTGYNADLFDEICQLRHEFRHPVNVLGYTNRIPDLMSGAALLVTKPGALTCTEAAAVQVPMVLYSPIPGQEEANAMYMKDKGCAAWARGLDDLAGIVDDLLRHPEKLCAMSDASCSCHCDGAGVIASQIYRLVFSDERRDTFQGREYSHETMEVSRIGL